MDAFTALAKTGKPTALQSGMIDPLGKADRLICASGWIRIRGFDAFSFFSTLRSGPGALNVGVAGP